ncbi:hypothetical protein [Euzebya tangerina]|uniref:hypothetical protein n=1 Tax=Euzebya tangerina TaxID=591198 RepID=UPI000E30DF10|nr:hypothetical protein [Euzebya tangerina]
MTVAAGTLNLILGITYFVIATIIAMDLERSMRRRGYSHFGVGWLAVMFTCGAHHLVHAIHLVGEGRSIGSLDVVAVTLGVPAGLVFSYFRVQTARGGRGDRLISGTPTWLRRAALLYVMAGTAVLAGSIGLLVTRLSYTDPRLLPNVVMVGMYALIGRELWRGQRQIQQRLDGWSMSGLSLMLIFPTCALMHAVYVVYAATDLFTPDYHGLWVDWLGVPAAIYFYWVIRGLAAGSIQDWNERFEDVDDVPSGTPALVDIR